MQNSPQPPTQREYWNGRVGEEWVAQADRMDAMLEPLTGAALAKSEFLSGERILDIGCGAGATTLRIARRVGAKGSVVGLDLSAPLLDCARGRAERNGLAIDFVEADASVAALGKAFDAAFSRFGVMFFEEPIAAFAHLRGLLRTGGRLIFVCWRSLKENGWATTPIEAIRPMLKAPVQPPNPDAPGPFSLEDPDKIKRILGDAKWRDITVSPWDGLITIGGGGSVAEAAQFMRKIGHCARAIADQDLDPVEVQRRLVEHLSVLHKPAGVSLPAACWIVRAET